VYGSSFATSTSNPLIGCDGFAISPGQNLEVLGLGTSTISRIGGGGDANPTSIFGFKMNSFGPNKLPYCAVVAVTKYYADVDPVDGYKERLITYIKSRGYNSCDALNLRRVERGIEVTY
jgi:hypothetical protein